MMNDHPVLRLVINCYVIDVELLRPLIRKEGLLRFPGIILLIIDRLNIHTIHPSMKRVFLMRLANGILFVLACTLAGTGFLLAFRLPPGSHGDTVLGFTRHEWGDVHLYLGISAVIVTIVHLLQNWAWLVKVANKGRIWLLTLVFSLGATLIIIPVLLPKKETENGHRQPREQRANDRPSSERETPGPGRGYGRGAGHGRERH